MSKREMDPKPEGWGAALRVRQTVFNPIRNWNRAYSAAGRDTLFSGRTAASRAMDASEALQTCCRTDRPVGREPHWHPWRRQQNLARENSAYLDLSHNRHLGFGAGFEQRLKTGVKAAHIHVKRGIGKGVSKLVVIVNRHSGTRCWHQLSRSIISNNFSLPSSSTSRFRTGASLAFSLTWAKISDTSS